MEQFVLDNLWKILCAGALLCTGGGVWMTVVYLTLSRIANGIEVNSGLIRHHSHPEPGGPPVFSSAAVANGASIDRHLDAARP